ncbi:MAG TPA: DAK2 domain-containing protein [Pedococcus sp.]|uniref:DAK2 domain-containing protein n=1 Tax=Pedococcus sp. TaxID=2860345 RepID=UPI002F9487E6
MLERLSAADARRWAVITRAAFAARRAEIDALNVFPVPDGDTGTNLYLTFDGALDAVRTEQEGLGILGEASLEQECTALARAMLLTARGNSGVILSQLVRGFAEAIADAGEGGADGPVVAAALTRASERGWRAVTHPVEGTILSVARAAADAAAGEPSLAAVTKAALRGASEALERTTEQLPALRRAGVVDAGGAGYVLLLEALARVAHEEGPNGAGLTAPFLDDPSLRRRAGWAHPGSGVHPTEGEGATPSSEDAVAPGGPAFEVMYLLADTDEERVARLTSTLDALGDSLLVVGGPDLWNVHVHVDDAGAAVEAGVEAGRPYRIKVTHFAEQTARPPASDLAVVACAAGPGLAAVFAGAGAHTVDSGPGHRASAGQLLEAARRAHALSVILLPNDKDTLMAAEAASAAAAQDGLDLHVVRSRTAVQGLAALAVFDPQASVARNLAAMSSSASATRHGAVTVAGKEALTSAGPCQPGDVLGVVGGDIVVVGTDLREVAEEVVRRLLSSGGELVTVVSGEDAPEGLADGLARWLAGERREVEVSLIDGGQPLYHLLLGVE